MITQFVFMTEEASMERFLEIALKKLLPEEWNIIIIPHEGKQDLERSIPRKLRAWRNNQEVRYQFIIIRDKDSGNCVDIKNRLQTMCREAGREEAVIIIAIHELEAWFLGDLEAIERAYGIAHLAEKQKTQLYRNPDNIANASEQIHKICNDRTKIARAEKITKEMSFEKNISPSFNYFIKKISEL